MSKHVRFLDETINNEIKNINEKQNNLFLFMMFNKYNLYNSTEKYKKLEVKKESLKKKLNF